jgi:hypothetical protein
MKSSWIQAMRKGGIDQGKGIANLTGDVCAYSSLSDLKIF